MIALADESAIGEGLKNAVDRGELHMLYQPKVSLRTGDLIGVEALMRWNSAKFGLLLPSMFIPIAERSNAIDSLTEWGLREALRQWVAWRDQGLTTDIAFNVSALTLRDLHFPDFLQRMCQTEGMPCEALTVEVTESAAQHAVRLLDTITRFRIKGMSVELDDFGTGYSSLLQLRQLPYTGLKVDICFIEDAVKSREARLIVKSVIDLAHGMGLTATAEGIENQETLDLLKDLDCDYGQGFFIAPPLKPGELMPWVMSTPHSSNRRKEAMESAS